MQLSAWAGLAGRGPAEAPAARAHWSGAVSSSQVQVQGDAQPMILSERRRGAIYLPIRHGRPNDFKMECKRYPSSSLLLLVISCRPIILSYGLKHRPLARPDRKLTVMFRALRITYPAALPACGWTQCECEQQRAGSSVHHRFVFRTNLDTILINLFGRN